MAKLTTATTPLTWTTTASPSLATSRAKTFKRLSALYYGTYEGFDSVAFTTITSGTSTDSINSFDADWTAAYGGFSSIVRPSDQELRLDSTESEDASAG